MNNQLQTLRNMDLLKGLSADALDQITSISEQVEFEEDALIFREETPAEYLYLITDGNVSLEICAPCVGCRRILTVGKGELLGWSPVLENTRYTATARALTPTQAVRMNGEEIVALCERDPSLGYQFMRRAAIALSKRLSATRLQLLNVFGTEMPALPESGGNVVRES